MTALEILIGFKDGAFRVGEVVESDEGISFQADASGHLFAAVGDFKQDLGRLITHPKVPVGNTQFDRNLN
mgnify:FL=1